MLTIHATSESMWDERTETFLDLPPIDLHFEHSLYTIHRFEQTTHKPFLKTLENARYDEQAAILIGRYFAMMCVNDPLPQHLELYLNDEIAAKLVDYINDPATATTITYYGGQKQSRKVTTAEEIYYLMFKLGIPLECEHWHFNTLQMLISVFNVKDSREKMPESEVAALYRRMDKNRLK